MSIFDDHSNAQPSVPPPSLSNGRVKTICPFCAVGCSLYLTCSDGIVSGIEPDFRSPVNEGCICVKGSRAFEFIHHEDRIQTPMVRVGGRFFPISWEEAYQLIAEGFSSFTSDEIIALGSGLCTNEDNYVLMKFAREVFGCTFASDKRRVRNFASQIPLSEISSASVILALYDNILEDYPLLGRYIVEAQKNGATVISADVRLTLTARVSDLFLQIYPLQRADVLRGLVQGDVSFAERAGVSGELIQKASDLITIGKKRGSVLVFGPGYNIPECDDFTFFPTFRECNTHGFLDIYGVPSTIVRDSSCHALYLMGGNPVVSHSGTSSITKQLRRFSFVVVQDLFITETTKYANIVLPAASFAEKDGTFTNMEGRVQQIRATRCSDALHDVKSDWQIVCELARSMGYHHGFAFSSAQEIFEEIQKNVPLYADISWEETGRPGGAFIGRGEKANKPIFDNKIEKDTGTKPDGRYPLWLTTGVGIWHTPTRTRTGRSPGLFKEEGYLMMHVDDAKERGIYKGDLARVVSRQGQVVCSVRITREIKKGVTWMPTYFSKANPNFLDGTHTTVWISRYDEK
jgi:predicted molibdopterin-dependent oxidoreductase YjgC